MGGHFTDPEYEEYNIRADVKSAQYVTENFEKPIIYIGFEVGANIFSGRNIQSASEGFPLRTAYAPYGNIKESWDPITLYCAVRQQTALFRKSGNMKISFAFAGRTICETGGKDCYMILGADKSEIEKELDSLII